MSIKLKALGLSLIAALAVSAVVALNVSAATGGHFVSPGASHTMIHGEDEPSDRLQFTGAATLECHVATFSGTTDTETATSLTFTPTYRECTSTFGSTTINMNSCDYLFTVKNSPEVGDNTLHLTCPAGSAGPEFISPTCTMTVTPNQTPSGGVAYTTGGSGSSHQITLDFTVSGTHVTYSPAGSFGCAFQATSANAQMHGSFILKGFDTVGNQVPITAT